jgi:hypothetical protein
MSSLSLALLLRLTPVMHQYAGGWQTLSLAFASLRRRHSAACLSESLLQLHRMERVIKREQQAFSS